MPDNSILDLTRLEEAFEDDVAGIADLLDMALETGKKHVDALRDGIADHDLNKVARAAHGVKGSASNIGASAVTEIANAIDDLARGSVWEDIPALTDDLEAAYAELRATVVAYRRAVL